MDPEIAALREELARAQERALQAEAALPHLLGLGQSTVNELLDDARSRAAAIMAEAEESLAAREVALKRERNKLEALYMAIAAEAAALENLRKNTEVEVSESVDDAAPPDLDGLTSIPSTNGFAKAWNQQDDPSQLEAFTRFLEGDAEGLDPGRRWIIDKPES